MKSLALIALIIPMSATLSAAQAEREFVSKSDSYRIVLISEWQPAPYTDAVGRQKTEFLFRNRDEGLLTIVTESLGGVSLATKVHNDLNDMTLRYSCLYFGQEPFEGGRLSGIRVALYYVEGGKKRVASHYYLKDGGSVWILRFTAGPVSPGIAHELTDKIARSFCSVCPF
jgi:hypothetical protein